MYARKRKLRLIGEMMDEKFTSLEELYKRLLPALKSKEKELHQNHMIYIKKEDIWKYLKEKKWNRGINLTLFDMVDDILNTDNLLIDEYVRKERFKDKNE